MIGLFSVSEILLMLEHTSSGQTMVRKTGRMLFNLKEGAQCIGTTLRSSVIGFFGVLPGAGATIASAITYMTEKNSAATAIASAKGYSRRRGAGGGKQRLCLRLLHPDADAGRSRFRHYGSDDGGADAVQHHASPAMFTEQPDIVWGLIAALLIANVMLLIMNIPLIGLFTRMLTIPLWFRTRHRCRIGGRGVCGTQHHLRSGVDGRARRVRVHLRKMHFPMSPLIPGFVLGKCWSKTCVAHSPSVTAIWRFCKRRCQSPADHGDHGHCRTASVTSDP